MKTLWRHPFPASCLAALGYLGVAQAQAPSPDTASTMQAIVYREFGSPDVLRLEQVEKPAPNDDQVLIRVRAASVNPYDWHCMEGTPYVARPLAFGFLAPETTRLGVDYAGTVEAVGRNVTLFKPGDDVFGGSTGALAEYVCEPPARGMALKPANVTFEQAASVPIAALTALQGLRDRGQVQPGQSVLINGASGGVGTFAVQIAKSYGAIVTGVCSTRNVELVRSLGADKVIDYTKEDFTEGAEKYDVILDNVGNRSLSEFLRVLKPEGKCVLIGGGGVKDGLWIGPLVRPVKALVLAPFVSQEMGFMMATMNSQDLSVLGEMMQTGKVTPVIDRRYAWSEVPEAMRYLEAGRARGKVVITVAGDGEPAAGGYPPEPASGARLGAAFVATTLVAALLGVSFVPIVAALLLNRRFQRRHPGKRPYRWGYYFSLVSFVGGLGLGLMLESGTGALIACGAVYGILAWFAAQRRRWAWVALTLASFNPLVWLVNAFYFRKRWAECAPVATAS